MVHLCTANGSFHARVLVARLGAEGILAQTRGDSAGPYPVATQVEVLVPEEELAVARQVLLFDDAAEAVSPGVWPRRRPSSRLLAVAALVVLACVFAAAVAQVVEMAGG